MGGGGGGGGGAYFQGRVKKKYCCVRGGGGHYMKNKSIGGCVLSTQPDQQKRLQCKIAQKGKKLSNIEKFFLARFAHSAFYKIHISGATAMPQFNMQNMLFFFFFFFLSFFFSFFLFSKQSS